MVCWIPFSVSLEGREKQIICLCFQFKFCNALNFCSLQTNVLQRGCSTFPFCGWMNEWGWIEWKHPYGCYPLLIHLFPQNKISSLTEILCGWSSFVVFCQFFSEAFKDSLTHCDHCVRYVVENTTLNIETCDSWDICLKRPWRKN